MTRAQGKRATRQKEEVRAASAAHLAEATAESERLRQEMAEPAPVTPTEPPTPERVADYFAPHPVAKSKYWGGDETPVTANPLSRAPYSEVRSRAVAARPNVPPQPEVVEAVAPESKPVLPVPTTERVRTYFSRGHQKV